ncbi:hypothetical protein TYRP_011239 [Tyrophagus putrescentiae]|nr:hypothetical protein TYRP_011239 [Tyrophagus putrescentiae]
MAVWLRSSSLQLRLLQRIQLHVAQVNVLHHGRLAVLAVPRLALHHRRQLPGANRHTGAAAKGEVAEELGDALQAVGAAQQRVLHLPGIDHRHRRVAEAANLQRLLQLRLGARLRPQVRPAVLLELLAHLLQRLEEVSAAGRLAVENVRQDADDTELGVLAGRLQLALGGQLRHLGRRQRGGHLLQGKVDDVARATAAVVVLGGAVLLPAGKTLMVGKPRTSYLLALAVCTVASRAAITTLPFSSEAACAQAGARFLQWPHQGAWKATITRSSVPRTYLYRGEALDAKAAAQLSVGVRID